jgi:hypothetical protein
MVNTALKISLQKSLDCLRFMMVCHGLEMGCILKDQQEGSFCYYPRNTGGKV